jgi:hypothetical protein
MAEVSKREQWLPDAHQTLIHCVADLHVRCSDQMLKCHSADMVKCFANCDWAGADGVWAEPGAGDAAAAGHGGRLG